MRSNPFRRLRKTLGALGAVAAALAAAGPAAAHPGHAGHEMLGLAAGLLHPLTGFDHVLAMIAVGLWAALRGGQAVWAWPMAFVLALGAGFAAARAGFPTVAVEPTILASLVVVGGMIAANIRVSLAVGVMLIAAFGAAHGGAHGVESGGGSATFALGMTLSTALLHATGLLAGLALSHRPLLARGLGAGTLLGGLLLAAAG